MWMKMERGCGSRGRQWEQFGAGFAGRWDEAQRGGGRQRRMFDGSELRLVLLKLIADETRHGYELIRAIETLTGGAYAPSPGVVYPTLSLLDEMGLIAEQRSDDSKRRYAVTDEGRQHLADRTAEVEALFRRLHELGARHHESAASPVWRALRNLGMAIRDRKARGGFTDTTVHDVAAMIDELAQKIERLR